MRNETAMYRLILDFARAEDNVRAVWLNGSRANPAAPRDAFQDYDIVFVVRRTADYIENQEWISYFGEIAVMQQPDNSALFPPERGVGDAYGFLMQFATGERIDLSLFCREFALKEYGKDKLTVLLLDKDGDFQPLGAPTDADYLTSTPSQAEFFSCCNEFWWVSTYVAKGLWRDELPYAMETLDFYVRPMLSRMLVYDAGCRSGFPVCAGKQNKYLKKLLPAAQWEAYCRTYPPLRREELWEALFTACKLMAETAKSVAESLALKEDTQEIENTLLYLHRVKDGVFGPPLTQCGEKA